MSFQQDGGDEQQFHNGWPIAIRPITRNAEPVAWQ